MRCEEACGLIAEYSVDNLSGRTQNRVREHIGSCSACARELDRLMFTASLVEEMGEIEPPVGLWNGVYNRITDKQPSRVRQILLRPRRVLSLGIGFAALAGAVIFGISTQEPHPAMLANDPASVEYIQTHASAAGQDAFADRISIGVLVSMPATESKEHL